MKSLIFAAALALGASAASAVTIDFDSETANTNIAGTNIAGNDYSGLVFTQNGAALNVVGSGPGGSTNVILGATGTTDPYEGMFSIASVKSFSVDIGDFNADADDLFLRAYDGFNNLIGSDALTIPSTFSDLATLSVSTVMDIARVEFGGVGFGGDMNVYFDNVVFNTSMPAVPLPAGGVLLLTGLGAFGFARRRKTA